MADHSETSSETYPTTIVLADQQPVDHFNPIAGYGELGTSPLYDGLLVPAPAGKADLPELVPALAASAPVSNDDLTEWTVPLREGVTFSDSSPLRAADVVATYQAILDPVTASPMASGYEMIKEVSAPDEHTVKFTLNYPYADLPARMLVGIAPAASMESKPVTEWALNTQPIGTGPYVLKSLGTDEATFTAREDGWHETPDVKELTIISVPDDTARAQRLSSGDIMGTQLAPALATTFAHHDGFTIASNHTVDWRGLTLPLDNPFTAEAKVRLALNYAVDREALVKNVLLGYGEPGYTPVNAAYGPVVPDNSFGYDPDKAAGLLDEAGWVLDGDKRVKDGHTASLELWYPAGDQLRKDLTFAVAENLNALGIETTIDHSDWDAVAEKLPSVAAMYGGGDQPYSIDTQLYGALHSRTEGSSVYDNPTGSSVPGLDEILEGARREADQTKRTDMYREGIEKYLAEPSYLILVFLHHTYVEQTNDWQGKQPVLEPHSHGVSWGPWWNIGQWHR
ncbi:MAG: ABC transporter substrate-binding protein [Actinomycetaceae bacterium]|nr:ABC transporter substrate-binding protein [Actinomycetaceae bacterium]